MPKPGIDIHGNRNKVHQHSFQKMLYCQNDLNLVCMQPTTIVNTADGKTGKINLKGLIV